jgi:hypothetical protein
VFNWALEAKAGVVDGSDGPILSALTLSVECWISGVDGMLVDYMYTCSL